MKSVSGLTEAELTTLAAAYHDGSWPIFRQRAHAMLLSDKGYSCEASADILAVNRTTVSLWIDAWEAKGIAGLRMASARGDRRFTMPPTWHDCRHW